MSEVTYGSKGWHYVMDNGRYLVAITCHKALNKHFNHHKGWVYPSGYEETVYLTRHEFNTLRIRRVIGVDNTRQAEFERQHRLKGVDTAKFTLRDS